MAALTIQTLMVDVPSLFFKEQQWMDNDILYKFVLNTFEEVLQKYLDCILIRNWVKIILEKLITLLDSDNMPASNSNVISEELKTPLQCK